MILTHLVMFSFFDGAAEAPFLTNPGLFSKIHQGQGLAL